MKVAICILDHEQDQWFFDQLKAICPQIDQITYITAEDLNLKKSYLRYFFLKLTAFFTVRSKYKIDPNEILAYPSRMIDAIQALPETSTLSRQARQEEIAFYQNIVKKTKKQIKPLFQFCLNQMKKFDAIFFYNGVLPEQKCLIKAAKILGKKTIFVEVGPFDNTILMDQDGTNYASSIPRQISFYREWTKKNPKLIFNSETQNNAPKIGIRKNQHHDFIQKNVLDLSGKYIFLPLQVFRDTQILFYNGWINNIQHLVEIAHQAAAYLPKGWRVLAKEHPECFQRYDVRKMETERFLFANGNTTPDLIQNASLIVTLNSSVGLEAMLFDKPVITLGQAFYAFDGLTHQCRSAEEVFEIFKNPEQISFNQKDRRAFLSWLANDYYLDGSFYQKTFPINEKNKHLISRILRLSQTRDKEA